MWKSCCYTEQKYGSVQKHNMYEKKTLAWEQSTECSGQTGWRCVEWRVNTTISKQNGSWHLNKPRNNIMRQDLDYSIAGNRIIHGIAKWITFCVKGIPKEWREVVRACESTYGTRFDPQEGLCMKEIYIYECVKVMYELLLLLLMCTIKDKVLASKYEDR